MDRGLDCELRLEIVDPCACTTEASREAGDRMWWGCGWCIETRFLCSFLEARGESALEEAGGVGVAGLEDDDGVFPMLWDGRGRGGCWVTDGGRRAKGEEPRGRDGRRKKELVISQLVPWVGVGTLGGVSGL
jgi:hypothetical protein